jgi:hypothetical protein
MEGGRLGGAGRRREKERPRVGLGDAGGVVWGVAGAGGEGAGAGMGPCVPVPGPGELAGP